MTVIGSGDDADLRLPGLAPRHAEIRRDAEDEYVFVDRGSPQGSRVDGCPMSGVDGQSLHTGDRIELGDWTVSYYREEPADHGRPFGGRGGGELEEHPVQQRQRPAVRQVAMCRRFRRDSAIPSEAATSRAAWPELPDRGHGGGFQAYTVSAVAILSDRQTPAVSRHHVRQIGA